MFDLELDKVIEKIKEKDYKNIMIQLPDGLKPKAQEIVDRIEAQTNAKGYIWLTSCYGACDLPLGLNLIGIDLFVQWGHNRFHKKEW